jgi:tetratricopeptide (TPR) repeat protein
MSKEQELDFEIAFFEGVVQNCPNFIEALIALGDAYTKRGRYKDGLWVDRKLSRLRPEDGTVHYNLACSYSLLEQSEECLEALTKAVRLGYREFRFMLEDPDLAFIRKDPRFGSMLSILMNK